jgi:hypothetical protein
MTVVDEFGVTVDERNRPVWGHVTEREPNVTVCWEIDVPRWKELLYSLLR